MSYRLGVDLLTCGSISGLYWDACPPQPVFTRHEGPLKFPFSWPGHAYTDKRGACPRALLGRRLRSKFRNSRLHNTKQVFPKRRFSERSCFKPCSCPTSPLREKSRKTARARFEPSTVNGLWRHELYLSSLLQATFRRGATNLGRAKQGRVRQGRAHLGRTVQGRVPINLSYRRT